MEIICYPWAFGLLNLLPLRSKLFPFRVDLISEGIRVQESKQEVTKVVSLVKIMNTLQVYSFLPKKGIDQAKWYIKTVPGRDCLIV